MKCWTCNDFEGHWPVGTAAVVFADNAQQAADALSEHLVRNGLPQVVFANQMIVFERVVGAVRVLRDGNY